MYKTEVCWEYVNAGHRCRKHASAAVVGVTDVEHKKWEHNDLVREWVFVRRVVSFEGYYEVLNRRDNNSNEMLNKCTHIRVECLQMSSWDGFN